MKKTIQLSAVLGVSLLAAEPAWAQRALGVDVSNYQGAGINWSSVKGSGISFAWVLATDGASFTDADFAGDMNNGKSAGVIMGAYHFAQPNSDSPSTDANHFWSVAGGYIKADGLSLMPMLDMEVFSGYTGASSYSDWANQWCNDIVSDAAAAGVTVKPVIYMSACNTSYFGSGIASWIPDIANYNPVLNGETAQNGSPWNDPSCTPNEIWGAGAWSFWQYSSSGSVSGISGGVDVDVYNGTEAELVQTMVIGSQITDDEAAKPVVLVATNGTMAAFSLFTDGSIHTISQSVVGGGWSSWASLGGSGCTSLSGVVLPNGTMALYTCGGGAVWTSYQSAVGGTWSGWQSLGGNGFTYVKALAFADGHLAVIGCGNGTVINYDVQASPGGTWSGWSTIGTGSFTEVDGVVKTNGTVAAFGCGGGAVYVTQQSTPGGTFSGATSLGGTGFTQIKALVFKDNHMALVGCGNVSQVNWNVQASPGGSWSGWSVLGGGFGFTAVSASVLTNQTVCVTGCGGNAIYASAQTTSNGSFPAWTSLGGTGFWNMDAVTLPVGVSVFGSAPESAVWTAWQNSSYSSGWTPWVNLGGDSE